MAVNCGVSFGLCVVRITRVEADRWKLESTNVRGWLGRNRWDEQPGNRNKLQRRLSQEAPSFTRGSSHCRFTTAASDRPWHP